MNCAHKKNKDTYIFGASISDLYYDETNSEALKSLADYESNESSHCPYEINGRFSSEVIPQFWWHL